MGADTIGDLAGEALRVLIVTSVRLFRECLAERLAAEPSIQVVGTTTLADALALLPTLRPNVVLADWVSGRSAELIAAVRSVGAGVVTGGIAEQDEADIVACAGAGVVGFLDQEATLHELMGALGLAARGGVHCSARVAAAICRRLSAAATPADDRHLCVTRREREIAELIGQGLSNKEIGLRLCVATSTVKNHVHNLLQKLGVHRRASVSKRIGSDIRSSRLHDTRASDGTPRSG